jgi:Na+/H+-dicarboxylate symporters
MGLGMTVGHFWPQVGASLKPLSDAFVALVRMMIAPIVFCTIVTGITSLASGSKIGRTILKALALFYFLTIVALVLGLATAFALHPGAGLHIDAHHLDTAILAQYSTRTQSHGLVEFALHVIPETLVGAFEKGEVLPVLLLALLFGFALNANQSAGRRVQEFIDGIAHVLFRILAMIMRLAPIGAFGAMAFTVGRFGIRSIGSLGMLMVSFYAACLLFVVCALAPLARLHGFSLWRLLRYIREELVIVLATSSTEPVLPRLIVKLEALGCDKGIVGLVLPAGYSFNLDGTAIYLTLASMFIAQACDCTPLGRPDRDDACGHADHVEGRGGSVGQRTGCARRDARRHSRPAACGRRAAGRHRSLHVRGAGPDERDQQRLRGDLRIDVGARLRPNASEGCIEPGA